MAIRVFSPCSLEIAWTLIFGAKLAATVVIPARFGSTRFPAKILASKTGRPLVQHVVDQVRLCKSVNKILVATDDLRIVEALAPYGTECVMTSPDHQSGTDRIAEVAKDLTDDIIVNVQGDEPEIEPYVIDGLIARMSLTDDDMATASTPFKSMADVQNPNMVKVITNRAGHAIYFSRSPIPFDREGSVKDAGFWQLHLGIYAYRRKFLMEFASWKPTILERTEKLEQLRAIEHGKKIFVITVARATNGIDTPEQYEEFVKRSTAGR